MKGVFQSLPQIQLHLAHHQECLMCAVSWIRPADGYRLFCNRDEKHTRLQLWPA
jgi:hypothetical protein